MSLLFTAGPFVSIIVPCYNVEKTIERTLDSILFQKVNFEYEIICVNDSSDDNTQSILEAYKQKHACIRILNHKMNCGNAHAFYTGLKEAKGKYFHVLDGDDFFTISNKIQKQVDFFEKDVNEEYCAVCHYYIILNEEGKVYVPSHNIEQNEFTYLDFLNQKHQYLHTSTYMFRNIYDGNPPDFFKNDDMRGDSPRILTQLMLTHKKIKVLGFYGSAYYYSYEGIWSKLNLRKQLHRNLLFCTALQKITPSSYSKKCFEEWKENFIAKSAQNESESKRSFPFMDKNALVDHIRRVTGRLAFGLDRFCFQSLYRTTLYDTLCASIGYLCLLEKGVSPLRPRKRDASRLVIVVRELIPQGGGIFGEIKELADVFCDRNVTILVAEHPNITTEARQAFANSPNVQLECFSADCSDRLSVLFDRLLELAPWRIYWYVGHNNPFINTLIQQGLSENVHVFSYDHGLVMGLSNPNFDSFLIKRPVDYALFVTMGYKNLVYIPVWQKSPDTNHVYEAFKAHDKLITACAAARWYKCESVLGYDYLDFILTLLKKTGGQHIHYGPIPDEQKLKASRFIQENGLASDSFKNIEWAPNLSDSLLEEHVDIFIEPFSAVSAKITLHALSVGVPVFSFNGITRMTVCDFIYPQALRWSNSEEFFKILINVDAKKLMEHSKLSINYYNAFHQLHVLKPYIEKNTTFCFPCNYNSADNSMLERSYSNTTNIIPSLLQDLKKDVSNNGKIKTLTSSNMRGLLGEVWSFIRQRGLFYVFKNKNLNMLISKKNPFFRRSLSFIIGTVAFVIFFVLISSFLFKYRSIAEGLWTIMPLLGVSILSAFGGILFLKWMRLLPCFGRLEKLMLVVNWVLLGLVFSQY